MTTSHQSMMTTPTPARDTQGTAVRDLVDRVRHWLVRSSDDRVATGLAGGIAARLGVPAPYVRAAFVTLTATGGFGVVVYLAGSALATGPEPTRAAPRSVTTQQVVGLAAMFLATVLALRGIGLWLGDVLVWGTLSVSFGAAAVWDRRDVTGAAGDGGSSRVRALLGAILMVGGIALFSGTLDAISNLGPVVVAIGITLVGSVLLFGPWMVRLAGDLSSERRERIESEARAEMAAHLHDSVLQTLALIQRSDDPKKMITLARRQERDLRNWLYTPATGADAVPLSKALEEAATRVEEAHDVPVDVVVVNDVSTDDRIDAVVKAAAEAMHNAARHSGAGKVAVYAEVQGGMLEVFVSDHGTGFDLAEVPGDRRGVRDSIVGRMVRHGGSAEIHSDPGEGTEVYLAMPLGGTSRAEVQP